MKTSLSLALIFLLVSCGQSSKITNAPAPLGIAQAEAYSSTKVSASGMPEKTFNDGYLVRRFSLAIVPSPFDSTLPNLGLATPVVNGLAKLFVGMGLVSGKKIFSINQPIPEIPKEFIHQVRLTRVFFVIEEENFDFINRMAVKVSPKRIQNELGSLKTSPADERDMSKLERSDFETFFDEANVFTQQEGLKRDKNVVMMKYHKYQKKDYVDISNYNYTYIIYTGNPAGLRDHIKYGMQFRRKGFLKHTEMMEDALFIELNPNASVPVTSLKALFENEMTAISRQPEYLFKKMVTCKPETCLDLKVADHNLVDLLTKENSLQLDAYVDVGEAPAAFKLKGFIQAELKIKSPIR